ncbi:MAG: hypothetical protein ABI787_10330 [Spartobacteria bacterium]
MSDYLLRRVLARENIELFSGPEIRWLTVNGMLEAVELENVQTADRRTVETLAVFSMIGAAPCTERLPPEIMRDENGFIKTGIQVAAAPAWAKPSRSPTPLESSLPGIFAAGRCSLGIGQTLRHRRRRGEHGDRESSRSIGGSLRRAALTWPAVAANCFHPAETSVENRVKG